MSKKTTTEKAVHLMEIMSSELTYLPSVEQRKTKSAFWAKFNDNPLCEPQDVTTSVVLRIVQDERITKWWAQDGFKEWFRNIDEFRQRMEYLSHLVLDTFEEILIDPRANPSSRVAAGKIILEVARKMPAKGAAEDQFLDQKIQQMDRKQLEEFVRSRTRMLPAVELEDSPAGSESETNVLDNSIET